MTTYISELFGHAPSCLKVCWCHRISCTLDCVVQYLYRVLNTFRSEVILSLWLLFSWTRTLHHQLLWRKGWFPQGVLGRKMTSPQTTKCQGWRPWRLCWRGRQLHLTLVMGKIWRLFLGQVVPKRGKGMVVIYVHREFFGCRYTTVHNTRVYVTKWYVFHSEIFLNLVIPTEHQ